MRIATPCLAAALVTLTVWFPIDAATPYLGLTPGVSTRADVNRVLGEPVSALTEMLATHRAQEGTDEIYASYRVSSDILNRLEVYFPAPLDYGALASALRLPDEPACEETTEGRLRRYFGGGRSLMLTCAGPSCAQGVTGVAYLSDDLFALRVSNASGNPDGGADPPDTQSTPVPVPTSDTPAVRLPPPPPARVTRDPAACHDLYIWAGSEEAAAKRARDVGRRQLAMEIRIQAQRGDCEQARMLADRYKVRYR